MWLKVCLLDETEFWTPDITEKTGRIFGVYLYDPEVHVHCAELTPSYELYFLQSAVEKSPKDEYEREELLDLIEEADQQSEEVRYYHCSTIDCLPKIKAGQLAEGVYNLGRYRRTETIIDDVIDDYRGNPDY